MAFRAEVTDFGAFYERTYQVAFRTALGIVGDYALAADVTQQAYADAYEHRASFRGDAPGHAWLHRIVVNSALATLRRRRPVVVREIMPGDRSSEQVSPETVDRFDLFAALAQLSPRQRAVVVLRYYHDYDYAAIALILGTTPTNVGSMLSRSLDRLRAELEPPVAAGIEGR